MPATLEAPALTDLYERDEVAWYGAMIELIELERLLLQLLTAHPTNEAGTTHLKFVLRRVRTMRGGREGNRVRWEVNHLADGNGNG